MIPTGLQSGYDLLALILADTWPLVLPPESYYSRKKLLTAIPHGMAKVLDFA